MKPSKAQLEALVEQLQGVSVNDRLTVAVTGDRDGRLVVGVRDEWGHEFVRIDRQGLVTAQSERLSEAGVGL